MILSAVGDWIKDLFSNLDGWLTGLTQFDQRLWDLYNTAIAPLSEWVKLLGALILVIIVIFGLFSIIKKAYKVVLVVGILYAIFVGLSFLVNK